MIESKLIPDIEGRVIQHRRFVTRWFYKTLKPIVWTKQPKQVAYFFGVVSYMQSWTNEKGHIADYDLKQQLDKVNTKSSVAAFPGRAA